MAQHSSRVYSTLTVKTFLKLHSLCWQYKTEIRAESKDIKDEFPLKLALALCCKVNLLTKNSFKTKHGSWIVLKSSVDVNKLRDFWNYSTQFLEVNKYFERTEKFGCGIKSAGTEQNTQKTNSAVVERISERFFHEIPSWRDINKRWAWIVPVVTEYVQNTSAWEFKSSCPSTSPVSPHTPLTRILWWRRPEGNQRATSSRVTCVPSH